MSLILNIETSTTNCSVSLAKEGVVLAIKELDTVNYSHAEKLHVFIKEVLQNTGTKMNELEAIAVSKGPGSYTGLRIGVSAAKGLCYALGKPLISVSTLKSMAAQCVLTEENALIVPVLDARRMEVYAAVFDAQLNQIRETRAEVIDEYSFKEFIDSKSIHFVGSGSEKIKNSLRQEHIAYHCDVVPSAREMASISFEKYKTRETEDVAYFEPYYLKDFVLQTKSN